MADIFLSYAREDKSSARMLATALEGHGWSVWWDRQIPHGKDFDLYIEQQLGAARCIVVLWSNASITSRYVRAEANEGLDDGRLVPVLVEGVKQPLAFRQLQAADLSDWRNQPGHEEFDHFLRSVSAIVPAARPMTQRRADSSGPADSVTSPNATTPTPTRPGSAAAPLFEPTRRGSPSPSAAPREPIRQKANDKPAAKESPIEGQWVSLDGTETLDLQDGAFVWVQGKGTSNHTVTGQYFEAFERIVLTMGGSFIYDYDSPSIIQTAVSQLEMSVRRVGDQLVLSDRSFNESSDWPGGSGIYVFKPRISS